MSSLRDMASGIGGGNGNNNGPGNGSSTAGDTTSGQAGTRDQVSSNVKTTGSAFVAGGQGPSLPAVTVPSGGGALRSMNEAFNFDLSTGTASLGYQVPVTQIERWGTPSLELTYSSGGGLSSYGLGWTLAGLESITRSAKLGLPTYGDQDIFEYHGDQLVPVLPFKIESSDGYIIKQYKKRVDSNHERIECWISEANTANMHWRVYAGDNTTRLFGYDSLSQTASGDRIYAWHYCQGYDGCGNAQLVKYKAEDGALVDLSTANEKNRSLQSRKTQVYPKRILYGNRLPNRTDNWSVILPADLSEDSWLFELVLDYGEHHTEDPKPSESMAWSVRKDATSSYEAGFEVRNYRLCHRFLMFHHFRELKPDCLVSAFELEFDEDESLTYLTGLCIVGYKANQAGDGYISKRLPPTEFSYSQAPDANQLRELSLQSFDRESLHSLPSGITAQLDWMDLFGDGTTGVLARSGNGDNWYYKRNLSVVTPNLNGAVDVVVKLGDAEEIGIRPSLSDGNGQFKASFQDLEGDGSTDLVITSNNGVNGFFKGSKQVGNTSTAIWQTFQPFAQWPNLDLNDPNLRQIDLTGIGRSDLLITTDDVYVWHKSLGEQGYAPEQRVLLALDEERGPRALFADSTESIYLADMSGDGLVDIVRILNGQVCYWPNMGYGRFGAKITMDHAPFFDHDDSFSPQRLLLGDVDGSGTTDLLYFGLSGATLYYNQAGNSWKEAIQLPALVPRFDSITKIYAVNLLGTGMCLIWQSTGADASGSPFQSIQYVDLTQGIKPHLLKWFSNNKGLETTLTYQTSTTYYLQDEQVGQPWLTTIPTPVHCIDKVVENDYIRKSRISQRYRYHHGYYDAVERSFCGFGMVEKWDTEEFNVLAAAIGDKDVTNVHPAAFVAPVHSKTWFHVGAFKDTNTLRLAYAQEFYSEHRPDASTPPHALDNNLLDKFSCIVTGHTYTDEELRQATYALKGAMIREEMYSDQSTIPYTVGEYGNTVVLTQPQADNSFISCQTYQHESLESDFDTNIADVRTVQEMKLLVDQFGNTLKGVSIYYGRGITAESERDFNEDEDHLRQKQTRVVYTEAGFTNEISVPSIYRHPGPCFTLAYELVGLQPGAAGLYQYTDFAGNDDFSPVADLLDMEYFQDGVEVAPFEGLQIMTRPSRGKRLVSSSRLFYRADDQSRRLALGDMQSLSIVDQEFTLCLTSSMLPIYTRNDRSLLPSSTVFSDAHYVDLDNDGSWWKPGQKLFFSVAETTTAADELAAARLSFFQSRRVVDARGNSHTIDLDAYQLVPIRSNDAYGNQISSSIDYRTLCSVSITDINGNRTDFAYDATSTLVGIAVVGKGGDQSDSLTGFNPDLTQEELDRYFRMPASQAREILGTATTCYFYSPNQYSDHQLPAYLTTIQGENYGGRRKQVQISFSYFDGQDETIQSKSIAENKQWRVSGWHVLNNKGSPVEVYTPTFSDRHNFEADAKSETRELIFYDARSREVATLYPDHTWTKTSYSNWSTTTYNQNNLVDRSPDQDPDIGAAVRSLESSAYTPTWYDNQRIQGSTPAEQVAAQKAYEHIGRSSRVHLDAQGQILMQVSEVTSDHLVRQRTYFNSQGRHVVVRDALGRIAEQNIYDMLGNIVLSATIDTGWTWTLVDATTNKLYSWTPTSQWRQEYDKLNRPTQIYYKQAENAELCVFKSEYGENLDAASAGAKNLRGKPYKLYDQSGVRINQEYDVTGNCVASDQQLAVEYKLHLDWLTDVQLEPAILSSKRTFDALGRITFSQAPDGAQTMYTYNEGGLLFGVSGRLGVANDGDWKEYISATTYDEQKRVETQQTNGSVFSIYHYHPISQRLAQKEVVYGVRRWQDVEYFYDAKGNLVSQVDTMQSDVYFRNARVTAGSEYTYDNLDRLILATGREHIGQTRGRPFSSSLGTSAAAIGRTVAAADGSTLARYMEGYSFDDCGNILQIRHEIADAQSPGWTRRLAYTEASKIEPQKSSNALSCSIVGNVTERLSYDEYGNTTSMPNVSKANWDPWNRLKSTVTQVKKTGSPETTYYVYDITGRRVRKVVERASDDDSKTNSKSSQIYYFDNTDHIQKFDSQGSVSLECRTSKITSNGGVCVLLEQWSGKLQISKGLPSLLIRFQYQDSTKSVFLETDDEDNIISYEEYTPFGSTVYHANIINAPKRYRFAGKERDHETGFYYNEQRYYVPWLCRWLNPDPAGTIDGFNLYVYVGGNPITYSDPTGTVKTPKKQKHTTHTPAAQRKAGKAITKLSTAKKPTAAQLKKQAEEEAQAQRREENFAAGEELTDKKVFDGAHFFPAKHRAQFEVPNGEKKSWGDIVANLWEGLPDEKRWDLQVIRVPANLNQAPGTQHKNQPGGTIYKLDQVWAGWLGTKVPHPSGAKGPGGRLKTITRQEAIIHTAMGVDADSKEELRVEIEAKIEDVWKDTIPSKDIDYFRMTYAKSQARTKFGLGDPTEDKHYDPWSANWVDPRTGKKGEGMKW